MKKAVLLLMIVAALAQVPPLEEIAKLDISQWSCESPGYKEWLAAQKGIDDWIDIFRHKDGFDGDLQVLAIVKGLVDRALQTVEHISAGQAQFIQMKHIHNQISKHFKSLAQINSSWYNMDEVLGYVEVLNKAKSAEDKLQIAQQIATKIAELINEITSIQLQLSQTTVEVDDLYELSAQINEGVQKCQPQWQSEIDADQKKEEEERLAAEQARLEAEREEAERLAEEERLRQEEEQRRLEQEEEEERLRQEALDAQNNISPEDAELLAEEAEVELEHAQDREAELEHEFEEAEEELLNDEAQARAAEEAARLAEEAEAAAKANAEKIKSDEQEACLDVEEAQRRLEEAERIAEEAKKRAEEAAIEAERAKNQPICVPEEEEEEVPSEPIPEPEEEEEEGCTEKELEKLIDTLIDSAAQPPAYQPGCYGPSCQQPIIIIVEDDSEPEPVPEPVPVKPEDPKPEPESEESESEPEPEEPKKEKTPDPEHESEEPSIHEYDEETEDVTEDVPEEKPDPKKEPTPDPDVVEEPSIHEYDEETEDVTEDVPEEKPDPKKEPTPDPDVVEEPEEEEEEEEDKSEEEEKEQPECDDEGCDPTAKLEHKLPDPPGTYVYHKEPETPQTTDKPDDIPVFGDTVEDDPDNDVRIKTIPEYSFGVWTYFRFNGDPGKVFDKKDPLHIGSIEVDGTERITTLVGVGEYLCRAQNNEDYVQEGLSYGKYLDGYWTYIYIGYKEGSVYCGTYFKRDSSITSLTYKVEQEPIKKTFKYYFGGHKTYKPFNGIFRYITVTVGEGAFTDDDAVITATIIEKYQFDPKEEPEFVEDPFDGKVEDFTSEDPKKTYDYDGYREYSVTTWFRYLRVPDPKFGVIFRLTSNEPEHLRDKERHGDRTLSLFQTEKISYQFSSYTVGEKDVISYVEHTCDVALESQQLWAFAYFGYKNEELTLSLEYPEETCEQKIPAIHYLAKYWALYVGKGKFFQFTGKTAFTTVRYGKGSVAGYKTFSNYNTGYKVLIPGPQIKKFDPKVVAHTNEKEYDFNFNDEPTEWTIDGVYEYGYGFWTKFFITNPKRIYEKPERILIGSFGFIDSGEIEKTTLTTYVGKGTYDFYAGQYQTVKYGKNLDGYWNYIHFSYNKLKGQATGFVWFNQKNQIQRQQFTKIDLDPINKFARFYVGAWKTEPQFLGFNGKFLHAVIRLGKGAFIDEATDFSSFVAGYPLPLEEDLPFKATEVQGDEDVDVTTLEPFTYEDEATETFEYSVYGWFKYYGDLAVTDPQVMIRLTNNEDGHVKDQTLLGDRTLVGYINGDDFVFGTYDIGFIDTEFTVNREKKYSLGEYRGLWKYVWVGYTRNYQVAGWFLGFPDTSANGVIRNTLHFSPKYLRAYFGKDGALGNFNGKAMHLYACYGQTQCYYPVDLADTEEKLPAWIEYKFWNSFSYFIESDETANLHATAEVPALDVEIIPATFPGVDLEAIYEYGIGVWCRWLENYPAVFLQKGDSHSLFRFSSNVHYEDAAADGDRTLAVHVTKGFYTFSTYDAISKNPSLSEGVNYEKELEGYWNFVWFNYKRSDKGSRAVGFVLLSNSNVVKRVEINSAKHWLLRDYARFSLGKKEFDHLPWQGKLYDLRVNLGPGVYIDTSEEFLEKLIPQFRVHPPYKAKQDNEPQQVERITFKDRIFHEYEEKYSGVFEYSVYGFAKPSKKFNVTQSHLLVRVTQLTPDIQDDNKNAGDRTFAIHINPTSYVYSTYDYGDLETSEDDNVDVQQAFKYDPKKFNTWTYFYFGYNFRTKEAYAYIRWQDNTQNNYLFENTYHFVPHYLACFLGDDDYSRSFNGDIFDWYLGIGDGAFTKNPDPNNFPFDPIPPPDRILSALLANQGVNSGRLVKV